jgi:hypothetical protein
MAKVKRFYWVSSPRRDASTLHMKFGNTSEGPARCGRHVAPGWHFWIAGNRPRLRRCSQCLRAG